MPTSLKRMTFTIPLDMVPVMDRAKRKFYDRTQSDMIRTLVVAGLNSLDANNDKNKQQEEKQNATA